MAKIYVKAEQMERTALKLQSLSDELQMNMNRIMQLKGEVSQAWKSRYTGQYLEEMNVVGRNIQKLAENTEYTAHVMRRTACEIRRIEKENTQIFMK